MIPADGQADMTKPTVVFHNFPNALTNEYIFLSREKRAMEKYNETDLDELRGATSPLC